MSGTSFQERIILPALEVIKNDTRVKRFYFLPGMLSILFLSVLLVYQSIYTYVVVLGKSEEALELILNFFHSAYFTEIIVSAVIFILLYLFLVPVFEGGLIRYLDERYMGKQPSMSDSIGFGVFRFYPMFEYNNIFSMFKFVSILNAFLFSIRFVGIEYINYMAYIFGTAFLFSIIMNTLTAYTRYEIVLQNKSVFEAIGTSARISLLSLKTTLRLYLLMFIVNIRVVFNFVIFLIFPLLIVGAVGYITSTLFLTVIIIAIGIIFLGLVLTLGYMTSVLEVFTSAAWYYAYKEGREKLESANAET